MYVHLSTVVCHFPKYDTFVTKHRLWHCIRTLTRNSWIHYTDC